MTSTTSAPAFPRARSSTPAWSSRPARSRRSPPWPSSFNTNLLIRAADVCLKERRKTVLMLRETPLHLGHLRLMSQVTEAGAVLVPPLPAFYHRPKTLEDIIDQSVNKALDQFDLGVELNLFKRWTGNEEREKAKSS
jgi:4-hydroxy-3-polyprenylbenzoate decarboxylase